MDRTRKALDNAQFLTKGKKWYLAQQVDGLLEQLSVYAEEDARESRKTLEEVRKEADRLAREREELLQERERLTREVEELRQRLQPPSEEERRRRVCRELELERDQLISDIKALRRYRETCRKAVEEDARALLRQAADLPSDPLL